MLDLIIIYLKLLIGLSLISSVTMFLAAPKKTETIKDIIFSGVAIAFIIWISIIGIHIFLSVVLDALDALVAKK